MQDRSGLTSDPHILIDDESANIFVESTNKVNVCAETHKESQNLTNKLNLSTNLSKCVLSLEANVCPVKPKIVSITPDITAIVGKSVCLRVEFIANSLSKTWIVWSKKGIAIEESERIKIRSEHQMSSLTIESVMDFDDGRYDIEVRNDLGSDRAHTSLHVKGPAEPPGKPSVFVSENCVRILWSLPVFDGGSRVIGYKIDMKCDFSDWIALTDECPSNSYSFDKTTIKFNADSVYLFRVSAINKYGISKTSLPSDIVRPLENNFHKQTNCLENDDSEPRIVEIEKNIDFNELYETKECIGRGRFGLCKRVIQLSTGTEKAAKFIRCLRAKDKEQVYGEVDIMNRLRHKHLLQLDAAYELTKEMILITEYISGGELFERIVADDYVLTEYECIVFVRQICEAVVYMHSNNVMHLDLKPENILCKTRNSYEIKIIDFGLAQIYDKTKEMKIMFGTPEFVAPEIVNYEPVTPASDMWSIGVICYVLLSGLSPFMDETDAKTLCNVTQAEYDFEDEAFDKISDEAKQFVSLLLVKNPEKRLSADECLSNGWLKRTPAMHNPIPTQKLKKYMIQRKWQRTGTAIRALARITNLGLARGVGRQRQQQPTDSSLK